MDDILDSVVGAFEKTGLYEQVSEVDVAGLCSNPFFLVPLLAFFVYLLWRQAWKKMILVAGGIGLWIFSGSSSTKDLIVDNQLQLDKVLPLVGVGVLVVAVLGYLFFFRSE